MSFDGIESCDGRKCFASDREALAHAGFNGDLLMQRNLQGLVQGAANAGQAGIKLEDGKYLKSSLAQLNAGVEGSPEPISDILEAGDEDMDKRIANCAYECGKAALGQCPLAKKSQ